VLDTLLTEFPQRLAAMADTEAFRLLVGDGPPFALALVESDGAGPGTTAYVVVFSESGGVHGTLVNGADAAVRWAEERYDGTRAGAEERTDALLARADAEASAVEVSVVGDRLPVALEREGFVRLDVSFFTEEPVADPTTAWRAGLTLPEVHAGYAVERTLPPDGDDGTADEGDDGSSGGREMTAALVADLAAGTDSVVVGLPGSGKSTVCKRVACEWYEADRGTVLYRESGRGRAFESVDDLVRAVEAADGHALVVVEDAVRPEADAVFDAMDRLADREDVSFLLDARRGEWRDPPGKVGNVSGPSVTPVPRLDVPCVERLVEHFERTVGETVDVPAERLHEAVREEAATDDERTPGTVLLLLHRLATYADPLADSRTALEESVTTVFEDLAGDDLVLDVCVLANALNAAGVEVAPGGLYAVAEPGAFDAVDAALERLEGRVLFPRNDTYRTVHESWSAAFLAHLLDAEGEAMAAERFGDCVTAVLSLADDPDRLDWIARHRDGSVPFPGVVDDPQRWADETVEAVSALGHERPKLAPLFGDGERDSVALPAACSADVAADVPRRLGRAFLSGGYLDRAEAAFERVEDDVERLLGLARVATQRAAYDQAVARGEECLALAADDDRLVEARARLQIGSALDAQGDYDGASTHLTAALDGFEAVGDRRRMARTLDRLGYLAYNRGEYDRAREALERSLDVRRELGDRRGVASCLRGLGKLAFAEGDYDRARDHVRRTLDTARELGEPMKEAAALNDIAMAAGNQGEYETAAEYQRRALEIAREVGDRDAEAALLGNLGIKYERLGEYDRAREALERSLDIIQELGDRQGSVVRQNNLGLVAVRQAEHDRAREYFERGRDLAREVGLPRREANGLNGLGHVARMRGAYDRAREFHEEALAVTREVGFRRREADSLNKLGAVALRRGDHGRAREYHESALEIAEDLDNPREATRALLGLGELARERGAYDRAAERIEAALATVESAGDPVETAIVRLAAGRLALERGDRAAARERADRAHEALATAETPQWAGRARRLEGRVAAAEGDADTARDHWRAALETFEAVGATDDTLQTLELLVETCRDAGDETAAAEWCQRAREALVGAPEPVVEKHREWVDEQAAALAG
jgi:tetratricopeptide (TPR) repeat protein